MFTNNALARGNNRTRRSNSFVEGLKTLRLKKSVVIKARNVAEASLSVALKRQCCQLYKTPFSVFGV